MLIALDYDDTYTRDPELWINFVRNASIQGHEVMCVTMRTEAEGADMCKQLTSRVRVIYTNRKAKLPFLDRMGIRPDVWIDDRPTWILMDSEIDPTLNEPYEDERKCMYGSCVQETRTCPMIYIHWPGYYPTEESYQYALENLCPNKKTI